VRNRSTAPPGSGRRVPATGERAGRSRPVPAAR